jgi:hypothetical protein
MAAIVFPQNPSVNDTCQADNSTWKFDGVRWRRLPSDIPLSRLSTEGAETGDVLAFDGENYSPVPLNSHDAYASKNLSIAMSIAL